MDSPVRQYQKQKDYQRHKLFRKIRRRRKAEAQQAIDAPMKELRRRLKRYDGGKNVPMDRSIDGVNLWRDDQTGQYFYQEGNGPRIDLTPFNILGSDDPTTWSFLDAEGREYNPRRQYTGPAISQTTDAQRVANEVRDIQNTRTWRSDVADQLHNFGDALLWSTMAMNPEGEALMMKASEKAAPYVEKWANMARNAAGKYIFLKQPNSFTRGIGGREGLLDLVESGLIRGNPVGTEMSAKGFDRAYRHNRNHFRSIMEATGIDGIAQKYYNRSLTEDEFNAIKKAAKKYVEEWEQIPKSESTRFQIALGRKNPDPLSEYADYVAYRNQLADDRITLKHATSLDESGQPLAYFYDDARNPITAGHDYAASQYGVRINNASSYNPRIFPGHLHYSMPRAVELTDPNVEIFRKGPFGLTLKIDKDALLSGRFKFNSGKDSGIRIKPQNRGKFTALKKRTGKTTEQLTHSKNPLTRKRAIFAQNARKWRHK